jgi:hypothetical protein
MDDPFRVCGVQGIGNLYAQVEHLVRVERAPGNQMLKGAAFQILHG